MSKFDTATQTIADRLWVVLETELQADAITEQELRRVFIKTLGDVLAEVLVKDFLDSGPIKALSSPCRHNHRKGVT